MKEVYMPLVFMSFPSFMSNSTGHQIGNLATVEKWDTDTPVDLREQNLKPEGNHYDLLHQREIASLDMDKRDFR